MKSHQAVLASPIGKLGITTSATHLLSIDFIDCEIAEQSASNPLAEEVCLQLKAYFNDKNYGFTLPIAEFGSPFQQLVWQQLRHTKPGETLTYGELAKQLNTSARAIGNACRRNPIPIITPCHRIVAAGHIGGYSGRITGNIWNIKQWLLSHESHNQ